MFVIVQHQQLILYNTNILSELAALPIAGFIGKVKELHDIAYQLGVEESKEVTRGKYLNIFNNNNKKNNTKEK